MRKTVIVFALLVIFFFVSVKSMNIPHFMSERELREWFQKDPDGWAENQNAINLKVKGVATPAEYVNLCMRNATNFSWDAKMKLIAACKAADEFISGLHDSKWNVGFEGIDMKKMGGMKWKLGCFKPRAIEEGCPHTRMDIIFLDEGLVARSSHKDLARTMVHEKVHVYERAYTGDIQKWISAKGFQKWKREEEYPRFKNNPDLDGWIYLDPEGREGLMKFRSMHPKDFWDQEYPVAEESSSEHPYETLAYILDHLYWALRQNGEPNTSFGKPQEYVNKFYNIAAVLKHR